MYPSSAFDEVRAAIADFSANVQDPKAAILPTYSNYPAGQLIVMGLFYDGPTVPPGIFDSFTNIPSVSSDVKTRSYLDMIMTFDASSGGGFR